MLSNAREYLMCIAILLFLFNGTFLLLAVSHISSLGKSKSYQKKERRKTNVYQKILLLGAVESCKYYAKTAKWLRYIYWLQIELMFICALLFFFTNYNMVDVIFKYVVYAKTVLLDIPLLVYFMFMTKHAKHGGVTWKWEV